jgi:DNA-binding response OmpR family regulator
MSRILLVDDSPHAQRIGERILADEGFEVVTVSNADSALIRLEDTDPDVLVLRAILPGRTGFEVCRYVKMNPRHRHVRVLLTAGVTETLDEGEVERSGADGTIRKPFEASALVGAVRPLAEAAQQDRVTAAAPPGTPGTPLRPAEPRVTAPVIAVIDPEQVRAAVTVALDATMGALVDEITHRVMVALTKKQVGDRIETRPLAPAVPVVAPRPAPPPPAAEAPVRQITRAASPFTGQPAKTVVRPRAGSILGLSLSEPESPEPE